MSTHTFPFYSVNRKKYTIELVINDSTTYSYPFSLVDVGEITFGNEDLNSIILFPSTFEFSFYIPYVNGYTQTDVFITIHTKLTTYSSRIKMYESASPYITNILIMEWDTDTSSISGDFQNKTIKLIGVDIFAKIKTLDHVNDFPEVPAGQQSISSITAMCMYYLKKALPSFISESQIIATYPDHQAQAEDDFGFTYTRSFTSFGTLNMYYFGDNDFSKEHSNALDSFSSLLKNFNCIGSLGYYINGYPSFYIIPRVPITSTQTLYTIDNNKVLENSYEPNSEPKKVGLRSLWWGMHHQDLGVVIYDKNGNVTNMDEIEIFNCMTDSWDMPSFTGFGLQIWIGSQWLNVTPGYVRHGTGNWQGTLISITNQDLWSQIQHVRKLFNVKMKLNSTDTIPQFHHYFRLPFIANVNFRPILIKRDIINNIFELTLLEIK